MKLTTAEFSKLYPSIGNPGVWKAATRMKRANGLNDTEERYRLWLEDRKKAGEIQEYFIQAVTLKLGPDCRYTPDFLVVENDGGLTFVEVKGFMREDAAVKYRVASGQFPWAQFVLVRRIKWQWVETCKAHRDKRNGEGP